MNECNKRKGIKAMQEATMEIYRRRVKTGVKQSKKHIRTLQVMFLDCYMWRTGVKCQLMALDKRNKLWKE